MGILIVIRSVHGITTQDHCLWKICGSIFYGCKVLDRSSSYCCNLHRHWTPWSSFACCNCPGEMNNETFFNQLSITVKVFNVILLLILSCLCYGLFIAGCPSPGYRSLCVCQRIQSPCRYS